MTDAERLLRGAELVVEKAAARLVEMQGSKLAATRKDFLDVVTDADLASERIIIDGLRSLTPDAAILSEEEGEIAGKSGARWIIDPLDGTVNYASGLPWYSATIAYQEQGGTIIGLTHAPAAGLVARYVKDRVATINDVPVKASSVDRLEDAVVSVVLTSHFTQAEVNETLQIVARLAPVARGVRIVVSGAYEMSLVASGKLSAFIGMKADIVSHAAAIPLVRASGGRVTRLDGEDSRDEDLQKIASNGLIHEALLACIRG